MQIGVIGTGYVGLVAGVCFADAGNRVICVDSNPEKIGRLREGEVPFYEPGLEDLFQQNRHRLEFTTEIPAAVRSCDVLFIAVGTPEREDGSADMEPTFNVLGEICASADQPKTIVLKSTVPIGTAKKAEAFCAAHARVACEIVNNPEFLRQGEAVEDFLNPDRIVIGCRTPAAQELMQKLYEPFIKNREMKDSAPILFMDNTSAEMTKYAANSFLALKISFINELALLADRLGANINSVRKGFTSDHRINPAFFFAGIGYGGSCFPKDVRALLHTAQEKDLRLLLLEATDQVNERQKTILAERLKKRLGDLHGKTIGLWGLSFKPRTDDVRRAPSLRLIADLVASGAHIKAYDPVATPNAKAASQAPFQAVESALEAAEGADALVLVTEWNEFKSPDFAALRRLMKQPLLFDGRNLWNPEEMRTLGFEYYGIGQQAAVPPETGRNR